VWVQIRSEIFGKEKVLPVVGIEPRLLGHLACSIVTISTV